MYVSRETPEETDRRLRGVLAQAEIRAYDRPYAFAESPRRERFALHPEALAVVGDDEVWSQLVPAGDRATEPFAVFRVHFPEGVDNSGFVGWLASRLKRDLGTGVFVVCGQNSGRGGIFDYWGCPLDQAEAVLSAVRALRGEPSNGP